MTPRRAFYTWSGPPESMPWLRRLTVETFKKYNPEYSVHHILVESHPSEHRHVAVRSDLARYRELVENGGVYFDTDIVFLGPLPQEIEEYPFSITMDRSVMRESPMHEAHPDTPGFSNIGLMASEKGHPFFSDVLQAAEARSMTDGLKYQDLGVQMLKTMFWGKHEPQIAEKYGLFYNIPLDCILPIRWWHINKLFNGTPFDPPSWCIGVHWYGGNQESRRFCQRVTAENYKAHPCYLTKAIDRALA